MCSELAADRDFPVQAQPGQVFQKIGLEGWTTAGCVDVFNSEDELTSNT